MPAPLPPIGFWSYTSQDDKFEDGRLSRLRTRLARDLQQRMAPQKVHIFQDVAAIPHGSDWLDKIHEALGQSSFFIPIVTPGFLGSEMCCKEVLRFREREKELGRKDLIFPFRYLDISDIHPDECHTPEVLTLLRSRQWIDFEYLRYRDLGSEEVLTLLGTLARSIRTALRKADPGGAASVSGQAPMRFDAAPVSPAPPPADPVPNAPARRTPDVSPSRAGSSGPDPSEDKTRLRVPSGRPAPAVKPAPATTARSAISAPDSAAIAQTAREIGQPPPPPKPDLPPAPWADATGQDSFGPWASFSVQPKAGGPAVTQRLRWCPPGSFRIGSPKDEEGRWDYEDNGIDIAFAQGFWMFETPVTQALWLAASRTGTNPSRFQGNLDRPVEQVSFHDACAFVEDLNRLKPGLNLVLPSEAQWEYACRAGKAGATWAGPAISRGKDNTDVLNRIAWWGGNSGGETHPVGEKEPNPWGFRDMLGNVWEWCADAWADSHKGARPDGAPRAGDSAAARALRGGSWLLGARGVRSAYRGGSGPSGRLGGIGFRCARVQ